MRRLGSSGIWSGSIMNHGRWSWNTECHWISPVASPPSRPSKHGPLHQWTQCSPHHDSTAGVMKFSHKFHCFLLKFYHPLSPPTGQTNSSFPVDPDSPTNQPTNQPTPGVIHPTHRCPSAWPRSRCESFHGVPWPWPSLRWPIRCPPRGWQFPPWGLGLWKRQTPRLFFFHINRRQLEKENNETPLEKEPKKKTLRKGFINLY